MRFGKKSALAVGATAVLGLLVSGGVAAAAGSEWALAGAESRPGSQIYDITATPGGDMWLIGNDTTSKPFVRHLTGSGWASVAVPGSVTSPLMRVRANANSDVWALADDSSLEHWDGTSWSRHPNPASPARFTVLATAGPKDTWTFGLRSGTSLASRFDGTSWHQQEVPMHVVAADAVAANDVWAVGGTGSQPGVVHWDGSSWHQLDVPAIPGSAAAGESRTTFKGVYAASANDVWATGSATIVDADGHASGRSLLSHWNGTAWTTTVGTTPSGYTDVTTDGDDGLWINGADSNGRWLRHRAADGTMSDSTVETPSGTESSVNNIAYQPGTSVTWAGGTTIDTTMTSALWHS